MPRIESAVTNLTEQAAAEFGAVAETNKGEAAGGMRRELEEALQKTKTFLAIEENDPRVPEILRLAGKRMIPDRKVTLSELKELCRRYAEFLEAFLA